MFSMHIYIFVQDKKAFKAEKYINKLYINISCKKERNFLAALKMLKLLLPERKESELKSLIENQFDSSTQYEHLKTASIKERIRTFFNNIDYKPTFSKVIFSAIMGSTSAAPFLVYKPYEYGAIAGFAAGFYSSYAFMSCPNNRRDRKY